MKNKIIGIVLCLAVLLSFAACGGNKSNTGKADSGTSEATQAKVEESEKKEIEIKEYGYSIQQGYLYASVIVHNPNKDTAIELPSFRMTATGKDGSILGTEDQTLSIIYPEQDFAYAFQAFEVKGEVAKFTVDPIPAEDYKFKSVTELEHPSFKPLKTENVKWVDDDYFPKFTGEISNENDYAISSAIVTVLYRDADGKLAGGDSTFIDGVTAGAKTPFELSANDSAKGMTYEVYANNWD